MTAFTPTTQKGTNADKAAKAPHSSLHPIAACRDNVTADESDENEEEEWAEEDLTPVHYRYDSETRVCWLYLSGGHQVHATSYAPGGDGFAIARWGASSHFDHKLEILNSRISNDGTSIMAVLPIVARDGRGRGRGRGKKNKKDGRDEEKKKKRLRNKTPDEDNGDKEGAEEEVGDNEGAEEEVGDKEGAEKEVGGKEDDVEDENAAEGSESEEGPSAKKIKAALREAEATAKKAEKALEKAKLAEDKALEKATKRAEKEHQASEAKEAKEKARGEAKEKAREEKEKAREAKEKERGEMEQAKVAKKVEPASAAEVSAKRAPKGKAGRPDAPAGDAGPHVAEAVQANLQLDKLTEKALALYEMTKSRAPDLAERIFECPGKLNDGGWCTTLEHKDASGVALPSTIQVHMKLSGAFYITNVKKGTEHFEKYLTENKRKRNGQEGVRRAEKGTHEVVMGRVLRDARIRARWDADLTIEAS